MNDVFCQIVQGKIPAKILFENDKILAIEDIAPKAKIHLLIFPKKHTSSSANDETSNEILQDVFDAARILAKKLKVNISGYRILTNVGDDAGQTINHLHFHLLAGEKLKNI